MSSTETRRSVTLAQARPGRGRRAKFLGVWHGILFLTSPFLCLLLFPPFASAQPPSTPSTTTLAVQDALQPQFTPPPPGTYTLPTIDTVTDHPLLDTAGRKVHLRDLTYGKVAIVSFMYTSCADVGGCPLAAAVLQQIDRRLSERPELAGQVTLLSVSFDPERDTPAHLAKTRDLLNPRTDWHFFTTASQTDLDPILADFNQPVARLSQENGDWSGLFRHILKVYLLDPNHNVRNIYSTGLFNAQLVLNDIETILLETGKQATAARR
jgi:cytochrome c peroxidase